MMTLKQELIRHYAWLRKFGYNDSHSGNASAREADRIWLTPTGACADTLSADELVACTVDGSAAKNASYDAELHLNIYRQNSNAAAVFHSHGPYTIAMTMNGDDFIPSDFEGKLYFPVVPVHMIPFEKYSAQSPQIVADTLREHRITVIQGHGVYTCAESINLAYKWTCSLEHSAKIAYLLHQLDE